jgi:hypothetical protein
VRLHRAEKRTGSAPLFIDEDRLLADPRFSIYL